MAIRSRKRRPFLQAVRILTVTGCSEDAGKYPPCEINWRERTPENTFFCSVHYNFTTARLMIPNINDNI